MWFWQASCQDSLHLGPTTDNRDSRGRFYTLQSSRQVQSTAQPRRAARRKTTAGQKMQCSSAASSVLYQEPLPDGRGGHKHMGRSIQSLSAAGGRLLLKKMGLGQGRAPTGPALRDGRPHMKRKILGPPTLNYPPASGPSRLLSASPLPAHQSPPHTLCFSAKRRSRQLVPLTLTPLASHHLARSL